MNLLKEFNRSTRASKVRFEILSQLYACKAVSLTDTRVAACAAKWGFDYTAEEVNREFTSMVEMCLAFPANAGGIQITEVGLSFWKFITTPVGIDVVVIGNFVIFQNPDLKNGLCIAHRQSACADINGLGKEYKNNPVLYHVATTAAKKWPQFGIGEFLHTVGCPDSVYVTVGGNNFQIPFQPGKGQNGDLVRQDLHTSNNPEKN